MRKEIAPGIFLTVKDTYCPRCGANPCACIDEDQKDEQNAVLAFVEPPTPIAAKVAYVVRQPQSRFHRCHWPDCQAQVPPALFMCGPHWHRIPRNLQRKVWHAYEIGQEVDMSPSEEYLAVTDEVETWIKEHAL